MQTPPRGRVLVVEDDADLRASLEEALTAEGYTVTTVGNGSDALLELDTHERPRVILLDLTLPVMNGWELRALIKADPALCHIPIIVISGAESLAREAVEADHVLRKPFDLQELLALLESA